MAATLATTAVAASLLAVAPVGLGAGFTVGLQAASADVSGSAADVSGGAQAPGSPLAGGTEYGVTLRAATPARHPVVSSLSVPATATVGKLPRVTLRINEAGVGTVNAQLVVVNLTLQQRALTVSMGWIHTGRTVAVRWPAHASLPAGSYQLSLRAYDHQHQTLLRLAHSSGVAALTVRAAAPAAPTPSPGPTQTPASPNPLAGAPLTDLSTAGAVFPVQGPHNFGGPENRFGAARSGHVHEGQDVLTAEGTQVVAPLAGTISSTSYQAGGAGYYIVEHTNVGFDFFFAHCEASSTAVSAGETVSAGQAICKAGQTGDATAPHLHFEMWVGGWQAAGGHPIDPLPYLESWESD